jgi:hypothetical protein
VEEMLDTNELVYSRRLYNYAHELIDHLMENKMTDFRDYDFVNFWSEFETGNLDFAFRKEQQGAEYTGGIRETYQLFLSHDYNTRGHQQWFNFSAVNF